MQVQNEIENSSAHLYIGCGITKSSIPEKEWFETVNKAMTLKNVIL
jgi:isochorismate synthase